jgi:hypothetical protein
MSMFRAGGFRREALKPYKSANPFVWGAWLGIGSAAIVIAAQFIGTAPTGHILIDDPMRASGAGFLWGVGICSVRNWLNERRPG